MLEGIVLMLSTGIGWVELPRELGFGSGWTCWRRMHEWADVGVFDRLHQAVLDRLGERGRLGPTPTDELMQPLLIPQMSAAGSRRFAHVHPPSSDGIPNTGGRWRARGVGGIVAPENGSAQWVAARAPTS